MEQTYSFLKKMWAIFVLTLLFNTVSFAQWTINEGFEGGGIPSDWTIYDQNNDGDQWMALQHNYAHSGSWLAMVQCYNNNGNDWIITPQVTINNGDQFKFYARAWYGTENMRVRLSTSGNQISNFTVLLESVDGLGSAYQEFSYDLSAYAGQSIYLAIQWQQDTYALIIDDVKVGQPQPSDVGMLSIDSPGTFHVLGQQIISEGTVKNFGSSDLTEDFSVECTITDDQSTVVYSESVTFTNNLLSGEEATVLFPSWTPGIPGIYQVTMNTNLNGDGDTSNDTLISSTSIVEHYGTGGPDAMSYRWIDSDEPGGPAYNWIEINGTGNSAITYGVSSFSGDDNFSEPIPIGFSFPFYGIGRTQAYVDVNGELLLADNQWYTPFPNNGWGTDGNVFNYYAEIPGYAEMPALIAVFWDDLMATSGTGNVYFQTFGTSPNQYCVIEWNNLKFRAGDGGSETLSFEVILHENGDIIMQYKNVDNGQSGSNTAHNLGQSATIAIQNDEADAGLSYVREVVENNVYLGPEPPGNLPHNNLAIKFYIGEDNQAPVISHELVWNTFDTYQELTAIVADVSGILYDTLYYNFGGGWQGITHTSFEAPNIYHYSLQNLSSSTTVEYYFAAVDNSTNNNRSVFTGEAGEDLSFKVLPTAGVNILLAMPGNRPGFQDYNNTEFPVYVQALDAEGVSYDIYNWAAYDQYDIPDSYDIVIAYSNSTSANTIQDTLAQALIEFMDHGTIENPKNVFMASDNMASSQNGLPNARPLKKFLTAYMRVGYSAVPDGISGPDSLGYYDGSIMGMANSPIGNEGVEIPVFANDPDVIYNRICPSWYEDEVSNPEISSWGSFTFEDGPFEGNAYSQDGGCGVWLDNLIYKSFFISFDISQFTTEADIDTLISQTLDWFTPGVFEVSVVADPASGGTVAGGGDYAAGTIATVIANPSPGYSFVNWTEDGIEISTEMEYSFTVTSNRSLVAHFEMVSFTISATAEPVEAGTLMGMGIYYLNETAVLYATPETGYVFVNWTEDQNIVSTDMIYSFVVTNNRDLVANFEPQNFVISVNVMPAESGTITGDGTYHYHDTATLIATPDLHYDFINWTESDTLVSSDFVLEFPVSSDRHFIANFALIENTDQIRDPHVFEIYPNPCMGNLHIRFENTENNKADISLLNSSGQTVMYLPQLHFSDNKDIDISRFKSGLYYLMVRLGDRIEIKRVILL